MVSLNTHVKLDATVSGRGPVVTLLHALGADRAMWAAQVEALRHSHCVVVPDLRGHGLSPAPEGAYSLTGMADDVVALWDALGVATSDVVGLSLGGFVAQHLAFEQPDRVGRLVLADTTSAYPQEASAAWPERIRLVSESGIAPLVPATLERWFTAGWRAARPDRVAAVGRTLEATSRAGYIGCCHAIAGLDTRARLATVRAPTLVIVGAQDQGTPPAMARALAEGIPDARLEILPDAAHLSCVEQPEAFNRLLREFLSS